ncbi:MAG: type IV secretory system conjugative DNA transfer family protein [Acidithiobacillus sp.]
MAQEDPKFNVEGDHQFVDRRQTRRDITSIQTRLFRFLATPMGAALVVAMLGVVGTVFPALLPVSVLAPVVMLSVTQFIPSLWKAQLPLRLPLDEAKNERLDYGDPKPQHKGFNKARGAFFIGTAWRNREEIWAAFTDMLTHCLVIGGTGAGKTEQLISMLFNALACVGGGMYVDPKGGPKLFGQFWTMSRFCGRDDDLRILNFALGQEDLGKTPFVRSNTLQPFAFGKAESLKEIPLSLMSGGDDKGSIFSANGKTLMTGLMMGLVDLRKMGEIYLTINDIRTYINADKFIELAQRKDISSVAREAMLSFLMSMGWKEGVSDHSKWGDFDRQYSYAQNYFLETLSVMSDTYRHIFNVPIGDINMVDIILNRRMFLCVIPSLEKSKKELANLGKISLAVIRLATSVGLGGGEIMGNWKELVDLNISASEVPSFLFVDEYAAIAVDGFAEVFTQGRSLGISATVGSQDWAGIKKANEAEAQQIVANTKLKFIMTTDDPNDTRQLVESLAKSDDEEIRTQGYSMTGVVNYYDTQSAQAVKASRIDNKDLSGQVEGEWHLFFKNRIIRGFGFFAGGIPDDENAPLFVHHLLMVEKPKYTTLSAQFGAIKETLDRWSKQVADAGNAPDRPFVPDYADMEGCKSLGDVFEAARMCNAINASEGLPGLANKQVFSVDDRRDMACAAVYSWMEERPQATEFIAGRAEAERRAAMKKLARPSPTPDSEEVSDAVPLQGADHVDTGSETSVKPESVPPSTQDAQRTDVQSSSPDASQPTVDMDDDPLAAMERQMASGDAPASVVEEVLEAEIVGAEADAEGSLVNTGNAPPPPETESLPVYADRTQMAANAFSGLSQFVEEAVAGSERPLENVVKASSEKASEPEKSAEAREAVQVVKGHMLHVLTDPPYPSPPTPEPMETSKFRSMAERWIKQVKDQ